MTITALQCAQLSAEIYDDSSQWDHRWESDGVVCAHRKIGEDDVLVFRGSVTAKDWMLDAEAVPKWDGELGFVHAGFLAGMDDVLAQVKGAVGPVAVVTGHSLGGARARVAAGKMAVRGLPLRQLVTFGSPRPAYINLQRVIVKSGIAHISYRNRNDPVPEVPAPIKLIAPWEHTEPWTAVDSAPGAEDLDPLRDHSSALYVQALQGTQ